MLCQLIGNGRDLGMRYALGIGSIVVLAELDPGLVKFGHICDGLNQFHEELSSAKQLPEQVSMLIVEPRARERRTMVRW